MLAFFFLSFTSVGLWDIDVVSPENVLLTLLIEMLILKLLKHPYIVAYRNYGKTTSTSTS